ncbi:nucleoside phosphorylase domain-containing protein [Aspergillus insuetus]
MSTKGPNGPTSAAAVATRIVNTFPSIRTGLMVGIDGGIPPKVRLGDVVVGTPSGQWPGVVQWDFGKAESEGFRRIGALNNPPAPLLTALSKLEARHLVEGSRIRHHLDVVERKGRKMALKFSRREHLHDPLDVQHQTQHWTAFKIIWASILTCSNFCLVDGKAEPQEEAKVHYGLIASGNQVIKDAKFRDSLNTCLGGEVLCVEMEAAGVANNFPCLAIRELLEVVQPIELDRERPVKDVLEQVASAVLKTQNDVEHLRSFVDEQKTSDILNWVTLTDYDTQQADHLRRREANTSQWLLSSAEYTHWVGRAGEILLCPKILGAGKTIMAAIIIGDLL